MQVPEKALGRLRALASAHARFERGYFNNPDKYDASTAAAVAAQREVLSRLAHPSMWDEVTGDGPERARKMERAAAYCRRVGRADVAAAIHRLASSLAAGRGRGRAPSMGVRCDHDGDVGGDRCGGAYTKIQPTAVDTRQPRRNVFE